MRDTGTNDPGALKLTIKKFYRPSGASTQNKGVVPDIVLPSVFNDSKEFGESSLENPLEWDTIESAQFDRLNLVAPYLPDLLRRSSGRVASEREFDYVREDIEKYKKIQADKTVSLNENERLKEKAEIDARQKARDKERLARKEPLDKVYELSLKQCDLPGLPEPVQKTNSTRAKLALSPDAQDRGAGASNDSAPASADLASGVSADSDGDEEKPSPPDATLAEAEHILVDYLAVLPKGDILAASQKLDKLPDLNRKD
jgi:carboxyl-terminal processing protease